MSLRYFDLTVLIFVFCETPVEIFRFINLTVFVFVSFSLICFGSYYGHKLDLTEGKGFVSASEISTLHMSGTSFECNVCL